MSARLASRISSRLTPRWRATSWSVGTCPRSWTSAARALRIVQQQLLHRPLHVDLPALVAEVPLDLAGDARLGVGGQVPAESRSKLLIALSRPTYPTCISSSSGSGLSRYRRAHERTSERYRSTRASHAAERLPDPPAGCGPVRAVRRRPALPGRRPSCRGREWYRIRHVYHLRILRGISTFRGCPLDRDKHGCASIRGGRAVLAGRGQAPPTPTGAVLSPRGSARRPRCAVGRPRPGPPGIGHQHAALRVEGAVEEHALDPLVVMEVLQVAQVRHGHGDLRVQVRRAVPGHLDVVRGGQRGAAEELGDAAAAGHVELQAVHRARGQQPLGVGQRPAVLARRHVGPHLLPDRGQPGEVLRGTGSSNQVTPNPSIGRPSAPPARWSNRR